MLKGKKKIHIEISEQEVNQLVDEIESSNLSDGSREKLVNALRALIELDRLVGLKSATIARLRKIFGKQSEKVQQKDPQEKKPAHGNTGGSGRHGHDHYPSASVQNHEIVNLKEKDSCPDCQKGKVYNWNPGIYVRVTGHPPLSVNVHKTQKLRCNLCGKIFEAEFIGKGEDKFDAQAKAMIAILHYKSSLPFYRLEKLQEKLGLPVARSTLWTQTENLANQMILVWKVMVRKASEGELFFIDDTKARVLSLMRENELQEPNTKNRTGMYTTGILSETPEGKIILYFTGRKYSGENLEELLTRRQSQGPIAIMSDALNMNNIKDRAQEVLKYLCLTHGRRQFKDIEQDFKSESEFVLGLISQVYANDQHCKDVSLSPEARLQYHQERSAQPMGELKTWIDKVFPNKLAEPNSKLGAGVKYMQKHWTGFTAFLRHPGAPLDNNILEQQLRIPVLNRKNFLFFKSEYGAFVGDILLSIIKTCDISEANAFDYMVAIQKNFELVRSNPDNWMPWNYTQNLGTVIQGQ